METGGGRSKRPRTYTDEQKKKKTEQRRRYRAARSEKVSNWDEIESKSAFLLFFIPTRMPGFIRPELAQIYLFFNDF